MKLVGTEIGIDFRSKRISIWKIHNESLFPLPRSDSKVHAIEKLSLHLHDSVHVLSGGKNRSRSYTERHLGGGVPLWRRDPKRIPRDLPTLHETKVRRREEPILCLQVCDTNDEAEINLLFAPFSPLLNRFFRVPVLNSLVEAARVKVEDVDL